MGNRSCFQERRVAVLARLLDVGPDAELVGRAAEDVGLAVAVEVVGEHVGAGVAEVGRVERPRLVGRLGVGRLLPPAAGADHVEPAVAVDVADAEAVREADRAGDRLARLRSAR